MELIEVRRKNLAYLAETHGRDEIARRCGWQGGNYVTRMLNGYDGIGASTVKKICKAFKLEESWMNTPHPDLWGEGEEASMAIYASVVRGLSTDQLRTLAGYIAGVIASREHQ